MKKRKIWRKNRPEYSEYKQGFIEEIQEKIKNEESEKIDPIEKIKTRYKQNPQTSRCDRVSVVSGAQYLGEAVPFPEGEELDKKNYFFQVSIILGEEPLHGNIQKI